MNSNIISKKLAIMATISLYFKSSFKARFASKLVQKGEVLYIIWKIPIGIYYMAKISEIIVMVPEMFLVVTHQKSYLGICQSCFSTSISIV